MASENSPPFDNCSPDSGLGDVSSSSQQVDTKKDGTASKMRSHAGNVPVLPKSKLCPHCSATFTRTTHLNRHLRTHTNERQHCCNTCDASFTRSDLLTRHKRSCGDPLSSNRSRRKSCQACAESKIKCDLQRPSCSKCKAKGKVCIFAAAPSASARRSSVRTLESNPAGNSPVDGLSFSELETFSNAFANGSSYSFLPSTDLTSDRLNSLEFLTSSTNSFSQTESNYTPTATDFQSAFSDPNSMSAGMSNKYSNNMFEPFLSSIFSNSATLSNNASSNSTTNTSETPNLNTSGEEAFPFATMNVEAQPSMVSVEDEWFYDAINDPAMFEPPPPPVHNPGPYPAPVFPSASTAAAPSVVAPPPSQSQYLVPNVPIAELQHYMYLFLTAFQTQIPTVHTATWTVEGKPIVLLSAAKACGALFVKTKTAANYITAKLNSAREELVAEFAKNPTETAQQTPLIGAVVLLQTIGLFHQRADQRASSNLYHGMLVMMIRSTNLIAKHANWIPPSLSEAGSLDTAWRGWIYHELKKRSILLSYLHDTCHVIYFALPASYLEQEMVLALPCEDELWKATTATDWYLLLQKSSPYGNINQRLTGMGMFHVLALLKQQEWKTPIVLSAFAHFILIHAILRKLFQVCLETRLTKASPQPDTSPTESHGEIIDQKVMMLQNLLHNWFQNWLACPDTPRNKADEEPPFSQNALPFYWLGQVAIMAYQENYPPFEAGSETNLNSEARFRLVKQWLKHIRGFLRKGDQAPTVFWDELMKIRLQSWQTEGDNGVPDDQEGLLGFFPDI